MVINKSWKDKKDGVAQPPHVDTPGTEIPASTRVKESQDAEGPGLGVALAGLGIVAGVALAAKGRKNARAAAARKAAAFDPLKPYNRLPLLPPKAELETKAVLKACVAARAALAELKASGGLIPNQAVLINAIPLLEARDSSAIENVVTTNDALYQAALDEDGKHDPGTKEVVRYRRALREGFEELKKRPLSTNLFRSLCATIKGREVDVRKVTDTTLKNQDGEVIYPPPVGADLLRDLLANLEL